MVSRGATVSRRSTITGADRTQVARAHHDGRPSDEALMARVRDGRVEAFDTLLERYYAQVVNFAHRFVGSEDLALDVAHCAFAAVYSQRSRFRESKSFKGWLYTIVRRQCAKLMRHRRRMAAPLTEDVPAPLHDGPAERAERGALAQALRAALHRLPERERNAVVMFHYLQWSYDEISAALGCSPGAARTAASRGRARLRYLVQAFEEDAE